MPEKKNNPKSLLMIVSSMLIFGSVGPMRTFIPFSSAFFAFARGLIGALFLFIVIQAKKKGKEKLSARTFWLLAISGAIMGINWTLLFESFNYTSVSVAVLCYYMQPTITILLSPLIFKEKITLKKGICAAFAVVGMALVSGVFSGVGFDRRHLIGIVLALSAALFYTGVVMMNNVISGVETFRKTMLQLFFAGIVTLPYLLLTGGFSQMAFTPVDTALFLTMCIVHTGVAYTLYFGSMDGLRVQSIAILSYIDPVSALFFSAILLKEKLSAPAVIGAVLIIGSALISEIDFSRKNV